MNLSRLGWTASLLVGCGQPKEVEKPKAPDMAELLAEYARPSGSFDADAAARLQGEVQEQLDALEQSDLVRELEDALETTLQQGEEGASSKQEASDRLLGFSGSGFLRATRICNGWTTPPKPKRDTNGFMELTIGFTDSHLDRVVFAAVTDCKYLAGTSRVLLTRASTVRPAFSVDLGETSSSNDLSAHPLTFELNLRGSLGGEPLKLQFDFRVLPETGAIEHRVPGDGGSLIAMKDGDGLRIRAKNGDFTCESDGRCRESGSDAGLE